MVLKPLDSGAPDSLSEVVFAGRHSECQPCLGYVFQSVTVTFSEDTIALERQNLSLTFRLGVLIPALFHAFIQNTGDLVQLVSPYLFNVVLEGNLKELAGVVFHGFE